jgi:hypothetical protein
VFGENQAFRPAKTGTAICHVAEMAQIHGKRSKESNNETPPTETKRAKTMQLVFSFVTMNNCNQLYFSRATTSRGQLLRLIGAKSSWWNFLLTYLGEC